MDSGANIYWYMTLQLPDKHELDIMHLENLLQFVDARDHIEFLKSAGEQHYRLLAWLSTQFSNAELFDIGSWHGSSAVALSHNPQNTVLSFDIENQRGNNKVPFNTAFLIGDILDENSETHAIYWPRLLKSPFICFDIHDKNGVHTGVPEIAFHKSLVKDGYMGTVFYDDIHLTEGMKTFWNEVDRMKIDLTAIGHGAWGAGTGIVQYGYLSNGRPLHHID